MDYSVIQPIGELRAQARRQLKGVWGKMAFAFFILFLISLPYIISSSLDGLHKDMSSTIIIDSENEKILLRFNLLYKEMPEIIIYANENPELFNMLQEVTPKIPSFPKITWLLFIIGCLINGPIFLGLCGYFLKRVRGQEFTTLNIFDGFKKFFLSFQLGFYTVLFIFLWGLLFVIPGLIKIFSYSMAFFIMYDNPEIKPLEALKKSKIMMKGYKWKFFVLTLTFIGWILLGLLTLGIGNFWLYPYIQLSIANFYENLKIAQESSL